MLRKRFSGSLGTTPRRIIVPQADGQGLPAWEIAKMTPQVRRAYHALMLPRSPSYPPTPVLSVIPGAFNADPANVTGQNGGNGILIGETGRIGGSGSGIAGTGPFDLAGWRTKISNGTLIPGDIMYHYTGNYAFFGGTAATSITEVRTNSTIGVPLTTLTGPDPNRAWLVSRPGHQPRIDYRGGAFRDGEIYSVNGGQGPFHMRGANIRWEDWRVFCHAVVWGTTTNGGGNSTDWFNIRADHSGNPGFTGGENIGVIMVENTGCRIRGYQVVPGGQQTGGNTNEGELYWIEASDLIIEHCLIRRDGTGSPTHHKRNGVNNILRYNLFYKPGGFVYVHKSEASQDHFWRHCIFVQDGPAPAKPILYLSQGTSNDLPSGYRCETSNCLATSLDGSPAYLGVGGQDRNPVLQGTDTINTRNIYDGAQIMGYSFLGAPVPPAFVHRAISDENQFRASGNIAWEFGGTSFYTSLINWRASTQYFVSGTNPAGAHDQNSIAVTPVYGNRDPLDPATFAPINPQLIGGLPVGPDFSMVGPVGAGYALGA